MCIDDLGQKEYCVHKTENHTAIFGTVWIAIYFLAWRWGRGM